eukprot:Clim_evm25s225 gene=Clim_evmTU25s225
MLSSLARTVRVGRARPVAWTALSAARQLSGATEVADLTTEHVKVHRVDDNPSVYTVTIFRPETMNALTVDLSEQFSGTIKKLQSVEDVRAVVLTGAGKAFSAGGDVKFLHERINADFDENMQSLVRFYKSYTCVRDLHVPIVAAVNGAAVGAGLCLALACDIRVVADDAKLGLNFVRLGLTPGMGGTHTLAAIAGPQVASKMIFTGELVSGKEAVEMGVAISSHPRDAVVDAAISIAKGIATASPSAVQRALPIIRGKIDEGLETALWTEAELQAQSMETKEYAEGITALMEKRAPDFS